MAHLIVARSAPSFVQDVDDRLILGEHEWVEQELSKRRYPQVGFSLGDTRPIASEWHIMEYRIKEEGLPELIKDLGGWNLNPKTNPVTLLHLILPQRLWKYFFLNPTQYYDPTNHVAASVGKKLILVQWLFKKARRLGISPLEPIDTPAETHPISRTWHHTFILGYIKDIKNEFNEEI